MSMWRLALAVALAASCKAKQLSTEGRPLPTVSVVPSASASAAAPPQQGERRPSYASSVAVFTGDRLTACVEFVMDAGPLDLVSQKTGRSPQLLMDEEAIGLMSDADSAIGEILEESLGKQIVTALLPSGKPLPIGKPCDEQFPGRLTVASCVVGVGKAVRVALGVSSYDATTSSDRMMRGCLAAKGEWREAASDSRELRRERLNQRYRALLSE